MKKGWDWSFRLLLLSLFLRSLIAFYISSFVERKVVQRIQRGLLLLLLLLLSLSLSSQLTSYLFTAFRFSSFNTISLPLPCSYPLFSTFLFARTPLLQLGGNSVTITRDSRSQAFLFLASHSEVNCC
jgi:cellulose synthase/poly-beta-1,6-N-acetylglucosamine synthase-like glycosyltransferase